MQCYQNGLAYFAMAVNYERKLFLKSTLGLTIQTFFRQWGSIQIS